MLHDPTFGLYQHDGDSFEIGRSEFQYNEDKIPNSRYIHMKHNIEQLFCQLKRNAESFKS